VNGLDWQVLALELQHPGRTLGYRIGAASGGPAVAYLTDNELGGRSRSDQGKDWYEGLVQAIAGVDVLIHDAMYRPEMNQDRVGWGHSTTTEALDLAADCGASRLLLFHHDPNHDDGTLDGIVEHTRQAAMARGLSLTIDAAREGQTLRL
jgi:ribonuclease BN (tRNA processing enzyme)